MAQHRIWMHAPCLEEPTPVALVFYSPLLCIFLSTIIDGVSHACTLGCAGKSRGDNMRHISSMAGSHRSALYRLGWQCMR